MAASPKDLLLRLPLLRDRTTRQRVKWHVKALLRALPGAAPQNPPVVRYQVPGCETFFGYYDMGPLSADQTRLLAHAVPGGPGPAARKGPAGIGTIDTATGAFREVAVTSSWCWQMGARLRWHPAQPDRHILCNGEAKGRHVTRVYDVETGKEVDRYPMALFDVARTGEYGVALDFARLGRLRPGYGYDDLPDRTRGDTASGKDGLWRVDLAGGEPRLLVSFADMAALAPEASMAGAQHYANLVMIAPDGARIAFLHLWVTPDGRSHVRLLDTDASIGGLRLLADDAKPSHGWWLDGEHFLITMVFPDGRAEYRVLRNGLPEGPMHPSMPARDGHPSLSPDGRRLLTDSYPDRLGAQNLEVLDLDTGSFTRLGAFPPGRRYVGDELRCDLHPRWSPRGDLIHFDSTHGGSRAIYALALDKARGAGRESRRPTVLARARR